MRTLSAVGALLCCTFLAVRMTGMVMGIRFAAFGVRMAGQARIRVMPDDHALRRHHARESLHRQGYGQQRNRKTAENFGHRS